MESARPRKGSSTTSTNHGSICLYYDPSLHARTVQLTVFSTFEVVAAFLHRAGFNAVVVVVYRPGSCNAMQSFFDDFSDLLQERLSMLSAPLMISGDFNIYVDDAIDTPASKLSDILSCHSLHMRALPPGTLCPTTSAPWLILSSSENC